MMSRVMKMDKVTHDEATNLLYPSCAECLAGPVLRNKRADSNTQNFVKLNSLVVIAMLYMS